MVELIDADGLIMGRLAAHVAKSLLNDKEREIYIINAEKVLVSGEKRMVVKRYREKRELNHYRKGPYFPRMPDRILKRTVRGMLPYQQPKGREALKRLKVFIGTPAEFQGKKTISPDKAKKPDMERFLSLGEISKKLGANIEGV